MLNLEKIKVLAAQKSMTMTDVASALGMSIQALSRMIRENSTKVKTLEQLSSILDVPVTTFFDLPSTHTNTVSINTGVSNSPHATMQSGCSSEVAVLQERVRGLELLNQAYKEQIELLRNQIHLQNNSPQ